MNGELSILHFYLNCIEVWTADHQWMARLYWATLQEGRLIEDAVEGTISTSHFMPTLDAALDVVLNVAAGVELHPDSEINPSLGYTDDISILEDYPATICLRGNPKSSGGATVGTFLTYRGGITRE